MKQAEQVERSLVTMLLTTAAINFLFVPTEYNLIGLFLALLTFMGYQMVLEVRKDRVEKVELQHFSLVCEKMRQQVTQELEALKRTREQIAEERLNLKIEFQSKIDGLAKAVNVNRMGL